MKTTLGAFAIVATLGFSTVGCANKVNMDRSAAVPAAEAQLKVKKNDNGRDIKVAVEHLAPVERVSPESSHYVVWLQPTQGQAMPANMGVLDVGDNQKAVLETTTPFESFEVFVTAEKDAQVTAPRGQRVLWATVD